MELRIRLDEMHPPTGSALVDGREAWTFVGWIELMQALERLVVAPTTAAPIRDAAAPERLPH